MTPSHSMVPSPDLAIELRVTHGFGTIAPAMTFPVPQTGIPRASMLPSAVSCSSVFRPSAFRPSAFRPSALRKGALIAFACSIALLVGADADADIYQHVDKDGVVHFSTSPGSGYRLYMRGQRGAASGHATVPPSDRDPARFTRFDAWIREAAVLYQIPEELVRAVIKVESDYDPRAVSVTGARGLMQLMPETAQRMQVSDVHDPRENIFGGVRLLRILANTFNGDLDLTLAAYNAGEGAVVVHGGVPPYAETREYVVRVAKFYRRYRTISSVLEASVAD